MSSRELPWLTWLLVGGFVLFAWRVTGFFPTEGTIAPVAWSREALEAGAWDRMFLSIVAHGGLVHLAMNALSLLALGGAVETSIGRARYALLLVVCGVAGNLLHVFVSETPVVGASGAIFGLLGVLLVLSPTERVDVLGLPAPVAVAGGVYTSAVFLVPAFSTALPIAHFAHLGGLFAGASAGFGIEPRVAARNAVFVAGIFGCSWFAVDWLTRASLDEALSAWDAGGALALAEYSWPLLAAVAAIVALLAVLSSFASRSRDEDAPAA